MTTWLHLCVPHKITRSGIIDDIAAHPEPLSDTRKFKRGMDFRRIWPSLMQLKSGR